MKALKRCKWLNTWYKKIAVDGNDVVFKLDMGARVNVILKSEILKWKKKISVRKTKQPIDYSDNLVPIIDECLLLKLTMRN